MTTHAEPPERDQGLRENYLEHAILNSCQYDLTLFGYDRELAPMLREITADERAHVEDLQKPL